MNFDATGHVAHTQGAHQQQDAGGINPKTNPVTWANTQPKGKLAGGHTANDLTGVSLKPKIKPRSHPQMLGQKQANLGGLGGNWTGTKNILEGESSKIQGTETSPKKTQTVEEGLTPLFEDLADTHLAEEGLTPERHVGHPEEGPRVNPEEHEEPHAEIRLRDTSGNPYDHVDPHDVDRERRNIDEAVQRGEEDRRPEEIEPSKWQQLKGTLKALWQLEAVKAVAFTALAVVSFAAIIGLAVAIPFTGGGSAIALAGVLFLTCLVFQAAVIGSVTSLAGAGAQMADVPEGPSFVNSFQKLQEEMKEKEATDPDYKPSFADFYNQPEVKSVVDGQNQYLKLNPEPQARLNDLKQLNADLSAFEAKIKEREQERDVIERVKKREIDQNNAKISELQQQVVERKAENENLQALLLSKQEELQAQYDILSPQAVDLKKIDTLEAEIKQMEDKLKTNAQFDLDLPAEVGKLTEANQKLNTEIENSKAHYDSQIDPMKQKAKQDKEAIDGQFKLFLQEYESLEKLFSPQPPTPTAQPPRT